MNMTTGSPAANPTGVRPQLLFWGCFAALVATSFGFIIRALIIQDREIDRKLAAEHPAVHATVVGDTQRSVFGAYRPVDEKKLHAAPAEAQQVVTGIQSSAKKSALRTVAIFPAIMFVCYVVLIIYFKLTGGYRPVELTAAPEKH